MSTNWPQFVANWVVNDYAGLVKRHGPVAPDRAPTIAAVLRAWYDGILSSTEARAYLRKMVER
jgi:hypothetical protein